MRHFLIALLTVFISNTFAFDASKLPGIEGKIIKTIEFSDSTGKNVIVLADKETRKYNSYYGDDVTNRELFAYLFNINNGAKKIWRIYDFEKDCIDDCIAHFYLSMVAITDLDKDGISEIWIPYATVCTSEAVPLPMKIIMYEGNQKYAMRGLSHYLDPTVKESNMHPDLKRRIGGKMDEALLSAPQSFRNYAQQLWNKMDGKIPER